MSASCGGGILKMKKKKRKFSIRKPIKISIIVLLIAIFLFFLIFNPLTFLTIHKLGATLVGCGGIERYYTGDGFEEDYSVLKNDYTKYISSANGTLFKSGFSLLPVKISTLGEGGHFDCNDFSNAVICLSKKYNLECKPVFLLYSGYGGWLNLYATHFITRCENGETYD